MVSMDALDPLGIVGTTVAEKYYVESFVAEGGHSLLYRAQHKIWDQPVALKFLKALMEVPEPQREQLVEGFLREGSLLRELSSRTASILQAHDVGTWITPSGQRYPYLVLEWLEGTTLDALLASEASERRPPWGLEDALRLLDPAARALAVVHRRGIAHRDIKPGNLFISGNPRSEDVFVKVLDFGIAKVMSDAAEFSAATAQTGTGLTSFTPWYGSPEQFSRSYGATGPWTDVFALALILVEMMTFRPPLEGAEIAEVAFAATNLAFRPTPRNKGVPLPDAVEAVFAKALAVSPNERYHTVGEFWNQLHEALGMQALPFSGRPPGPSFSSLTPPPGVYHPILSVPTLPSGPAPSNPFTNHPALTGNAVTGSLPSQLPPPQGRWGLMAAAALCVFLGGGLFFTLIKKKAPADPTAQTTASGVPRASAAAAVPACPPGMVRIPGGKFYMGLDSEEAMPFEKPQHQVTLTTFCIDITELTVEDYRACSDKGACQRAGVTVAWPGITPEEKKVYGPLCNIDDAGRDRHPINCVDWDMATDFCKANDKRLPTSAEWEYAVRGPDGRIYPWGDDPPDANHLNACGLECVEWGRKHHVELTPMHHEDDGFPTTAPVGSFPKGRSRYGLDDVIGNVMEWVQDWDGPYSKEPETSPTGPANGKDRVIRGGAWNAGSAVWVRPSFRFKFPPQTRSHGIGFRCAKDADKEGL